MITKGIHTYRRAIVEQGIIVDCSYMIATTTNLFTLADTYVDLTEVPKLRQTLNFGVDGGDTINVHLYLDGSSVQGRATASADAWDQTYYTVAAGYRKAKTRIQIAVYLSTGGNTGFVKDYKLYSIQDYHIS